MSMKAAKPQYKELVRLYSSLMGEHQLWELWEDSMIMFACALSNAVDERFREEREKLYQSSAAKYREEEMQVFPKIFGEIVKQLEAEPEQDLLGDLYMQLDLGSHWHGQFFTPYNVCAMMAKMNFEPISSPDDVKPVTVTDCACGGGALLIASAHEYRRSIKKTGLNPQNYLCLYGQDISRTTAMMCYIQLSLQGYAAKVKVGDSLLKPMLDTDNGSDIWYTPMWFSEVWVCRRIIQALCRKEVE